MEVVYKLKRKIDPIIPVVGFILIAVGLVMILSASKVYGLERFGSSYHFFVRQVLACLIGLVAFVYFLRVPVEYLYEKRMTFFYLTLIILLLVFFPIIGPKIAQVHRWIYLGIFNIQTSEVAKMFFVIFIAAFLAKNQERINDPIRVLIPFIIFLGVVFFLVYRQPDLGTAIIIAVIALSILFVSKISLIQFTSLIIALLLLVGTLAYSAPYRQKRIQAFKQINTSSFSKIDESYHAHQALIAIGSGGLWGIGFGQGVSKYSYLPQAHTDSIFAIIAEELGFIRTSIFILLFLVLAWRGYLVIHRANSNFVKLCATGLTVFLVVQMIINVTGLLGLIPFTGVPIPFISYGGTSLVVSMAALGLLTNLSREVE